MAEILEDFKFGSKRPYVKYPWNEWLDGKVRKLVRGIDYQITTHGMLGTLSAHAKRKAIKVRFQEIENGIIFQAVLNETENLINGFIPDISHSKEATSGKETRTPTKDQTPPATEAAQHGGRVDQGD